MEFGAHLPVIVGDQPPPSMRDVVAYATTAERLGYTLLAANDHVASRTAWLDGPTLLTIAATVTERIGLMTAILLPALRHPAVVAKSFGTLDLLAGGRVIVGVGSGTLRADYTLLDMTWEERWARLDESIAALRALWDEDAPVRSGRYYPLPGIGISPRPGRPGGPPIWVGSWGSPAGLRRVARLGDGWIASAFNTTPERFADGWTRLQSELERLGRDPDHFDNALASMFVFVTDDQREAERVVAEILSPALGRAPADLLDAGLYGPPERCAATVRRWAGAGVERLLIWPVTDPVEQLGRFAEQVVPLIT